MERLRGHSHGIIAENCAETMRIEICGMYKRNWKPASSDLEKSQNYYRNGKHHEVLTTVWAKFSNP